MTTTSTFTACLDTGPATRWEFEPTYPAGTPEDEARCALLKKLLAAGPVFHDLCGVTVELCSDLPAYLNLRMLNDAYERGSPALIRKYVTGGRALVLGAGVGVTATALAQETSHPVNVVDANPLLAERVQRTATLNHVDLVFRHGAAVPGRSSGETSFFVSDEFWTSSLRKDTHKSAQRITVPVIDLLKLLAETNPSTLFIDIEGAEANLFTEWDMPGVQKLFVEVYRPNLARTTFAKVLSDIFRQGFTLVEAAGLTCYFERR